MQAEENELVMNIKSIIFGILSIIIAIVLFFLFFWVMIVFVVFAAFFMLYIRIKSFFMIKKMHKDSLDIEAEYEEDEDVVLVTAPDGTTEEIHLENSNEDKTR
jgi:membrane protein YdbS with pleckstrin-like domain